MTRIRRTTAALGLLLTGALAASACGSDSDSSGAAGNATTTMNMDHAAGDMVKLIGPAAFTAALAADPSIVLIDVRTPEEFAQGHIAGARNIDVNGATWAADIAALDNTKTYAVYCHSGNRSRTATQSMMQAGFTHLDELEGGIAAWEQAGYDVTMR